MGLAPLFLAFATVLAAPIPRLSGRVVDPAQLLTATERQALEEKLELIERQTSVQIVVAAIRSLDGEPLEDYSMRLAEAWRIGQRGLDNGVILLVVRDERRVRIEVGYGLESVIPDGLAGRIIRERIAPRFRSGEYALGLTDAVDGLALAAQREYPPESGLSRLRRMPSDDSPIIGLAAIAFLILGILGNALGWWASAVPGSIALPALLKMAGGFSGFHLLLAVPAGFLFGLLAAALVTAWGHADTWDSGGYYGRRRYGIWGRWGGTGGGFGGFSGGGGRFGGGGASGSW